MATRQYHADDRRVIVRELVVGHDFAIGVELADAASDELSGLRSEIENDDFFLHEMDFRSECKVTEKM